MAPSVRFPLAPSLSLLYPYEQSTKKKRERERDKQRGLIGLGQLLWPTRCGGPRRRPREPFRPSLLLLRLPKETTHEWNSTVRKKSLIIFIRTGHWFLCAEWLMDSLFLMYRLPGSSVSHFWWRLFCPPADLSTSDISHISDGSTESPLRRSNPVYPYTRANSLFAVEKEMEKRRYIKRDQKSDTEANWGRKTRLETEIPAHFKSYISSLAWEDPKKKYL